MCDDDECVERKKKGEKGGKIPVFQLKVVVMMKAVLAVFSA